MRAAVKASLFSACALALSLAAPVAAATVTVSYAPPAGKLPAGHLHGLTYSAVLPSGRLVTPVGTSTVVGVDALGLTLSPDGRFAIVGNDDDGSGGTRSTIDPDATDGPSLAVVDTASLTVVSRFRPPPGERYFGGIVTVRDPLQPQRTLVIAAGGASDAVYLFTLDAFGRLVPDGTHAIAIPGPLDPAFADAGHSAPSSLVASSDGRRVYVVNTAGGSIAAIDVTTRQLIGAARQVGFFPNSAAFAGGRLVVTNEGMMRYGVTPQRAAAPPFGTPAPALAAASSLSLVDLTTAGALVPAPPAGAAPSAVPMDPPADGMRIVGGAHPSALAVTPDGSYAFVAMTNVDRIATVALSGVPHVAGGTELRLFDRGPYGTQPAALALSRDASRLYVALRGLNAIAVVDARDPTHLHRLGLIPTGWAPSALALAADDRTLFVANQKGFGDDASAVWSTLQRVDLARIKLADSTRATLGATRNVVPAAATYPRAIRNVAVIVVDHQSFDSIFGDIPGAGDPALLRAGAALTPNLHALAQRFALAGNLYADAGNAELAHQVIVSGVVSAFGETTMDLREPVFAGVDDPEDAPRIGSIFAACARRDISYRDYGGFLRVAGFDGTSYGYDVPAAAALGGHVDLGYPGPDAAVPDTQRADAFIRDDDAQGGARRPRFTYIGLPGARIGDTDAAIGSIVEHLSHAPAWRSTAVIVVSGDTQGAPDHVDASRAFALVISPFAKRRFIGTRHLSTASVLKTVDGILAQPPLSLGDLLANDMSDFFTNRADPRPYVAVRSAL